MRRALKLASVVLVAGGLTLTACAHTPQCSERISNCLGSCPPSEPQAVLPSGAADRSPRERRTDCERRCQSLCQTSGPMGSRPADPAQGPFEPPADAE